MFRPGNPVPQGGEPAAEAAGHRREGYGQPRPEADFAPGPPTAAERARTLVEGNSSALLEIPGLVGDVFSLTPVERAVDDGDLLLRLPGGSPALRAAARARGGELVGVLEITDVAPVAVTPRVRGRASVTGWITAVAGDPGLLRLETAEVTVDDLWGSAAVEPEEFAAAVPDPLRTHEAELLQHLAAAHGEQVALLGVLAGCPGRCAAGAAVPVALDRGGLRVRFTGRPGTFDARFEFPRPVGCVTELRGAMRALFGAARDAAGGR